MFSKVYFLRLWVPYAAITLFTTLLTVYSIQPKLGFELTSGWVLVRNIVLCGALKRA
jgi:hypothetical protein